MSVYLTALLISFLFSLLYRRSDKKSIIIKNGKIVLNSRILIGFLSFLPLTVVAGIRYNVGSDYGGTYMNIFEGISQGTAIRDMGYGLLNRCVLLFTQDYAGIFFLSSLLIGIFVYLAIFQQSDIPALSILLFVFTSEYFVSLNMVRQALATAIFLFAMKYIETRNYRRYYFWIIIAITMHTSAILYLPLYFYKFFYKIYKFMLFSLAILFIFSKEIVTVIQWLLLKSTYLVRYFYWYFHSAYNNGKFNVISFSVQMAVLFFVVLIYWKNKTDERCQLFLVMQIFCVGMLLLSTFLPLAQRLSYLFSFGNIIYLPVLINKIKDKRKQFGVSVAITACFFAYMWITVVILNYNEVLPYQTIFSR